MASFFEKVHGIPPPTPLPKKARIIPSVSRSTAAVDKFSLATPSQRPSHSPQQLTKSRQETEKSSRLAHTPSRPARNGVRHARSLDSSPMRRTVSSPDSPAAKKRKLVYLKIPRHYLERIGSQSPSSREFSRRTASPAYRIRRNSSDNETDFSEPVRLFQDKTCDIVPVSRNMLNPLAGQDIEFMHSKDVVCGVDKESYFPENPSSPAVEVILQLPFGEERFKLLKPKKNDEYNPKGDILSTIDNLLKFYLPSDALPPDYPHQLRKAMKSSNPEPIFHLLNTINEKIISLRPFTAKIESMSHMPPDLLQRICMQCYARSVSPHLDGLKKYTAFSSTVYGELLFPFLSKLFSDMSLDPNNIFVDLGSGVGNCIIQASAETGCTSVGIEIMDHAAHLAQSQIQEFESRMKCWGLSHGPITFIHGDILTHPEIPTILTSADVVLCNNYAFAAELNDALLRLFLELPEGSRIISLKSFVPVGKDGRLRGGRGGVGEMLKVETRTFDAGSVSWMPGGGEYFISTVRRAESRFGTPGSGDV